MGGVGNDQDARPLARDRARVAQGRVDEPAHLRRVLRRRRVPLAVALGSGGAEARGELPVGEHLDERVDELVGVLRVDQAPLDAVANEIRDAADAARDDAAPAGERLDHDTPETLRARREHEHRRLVEPPRDAVRRQLGHMLDLLRQLGHQLIDDRVPRSLADEHEPRVRQPCGNFAPGVGEPVDVLVRLEHPDEERRRPLGQRLDRTRGERGEVGVRRERGGHGHAAHLLDERLGVPRERANGVAAADGGPADEVGDRREEPSPGRAVEAREGPPVAVHLEDHLRPAAGREPAPDHRGRADVRIAGDDRVGLEVADLPPHAERQPQIEEQPVEPPRPRRGNEPEALVGERAAGRRRGKHAVVDLALERVPLLREPLGQRERVAVAPDEEDARALGAGLGHAAASRSSRSSSP